MIDEWLLAVEEKKLEENVPRVVFPRGLPILLVKKRGQVHAVSNKCAHMACELGSGTLEDYVITCPCHEWRFDIRTGQFLDAKEIRIPKYETRLSDGNVFIKIGGRA